MNIYTNNDALTLQVVELHEENLTLGALQRIHIGCDEVWCLGQGLETRSAVDVCHVINIEQLTS